MIWIRGRFGFCLTILKFTRKSIFITVFMSCCFSWCSIACLCYISGFLVMWVKGSAPPISINLLTQKATPEIKSQRLLPFFAMKLCITESYLAFEKVAPFLHWFWELQLRWLWISVYADFRFSLVCARSCPCSVKTCQIKRQCLKMSPVGC